MQSVKRTTRFKLSGVLFLAAAFSGGGFNGAGAASSSSSPTMAQRWVKSCLPYQIVDIGFQITCMTAQALATTTRVKRERAFGLTVGDFQHRYKAYVDRQGGPLIQGCDRKGTGWSCHFTNRPAAAIGRFDILGAVETLGGAAGAISRVTVTGNRLENPLAYLAVMGALIETLGPEVSQEEATRIHEALGLTGDQIDPEQSARNGDLSIRCKEEPHGLATCVLEPN